MHHFHGSYRLYFGESHMIKFVPLLAFSIVHFQLTRNPKGSAYSKERMTSLFLFIRQTSQNAADAGSSPGVVSRAAGRCELREQRTWTTSKGERQLCEEGREGATQAGERATKQRSPPLRGSSTPTTRTSHRPLPLRSRTFAIGRQQPNFISKTNLKRVMELKFVSNTSMLSSLWDNRWLGSANEKTWLHKF